MNWFEHNDVVIMDNAAIHSGAEAKIVTDILWSHIMPDGELLRVLVVPLPT